MTSQPEARYVVVFRAVIARLDDDYAAMAQRLRARALAEFGCLGFHALTEGEHEVALSYWPDLESIRAWQQDPEHLEAQRLGSTIWYREHSVAVTRIERSYQRGR